MFGLSAYNAPILLLLMVAPDPMRRPAAAFPLNRRGLSSSPIDFTIRKDSCCDEKTNSSTRIKSAWGGDFEGQVRIHAVGVDSYTPHYYQYHQQGDDEYLYLHFKCNSFCSFLQRGWVGVVKNS